VIEIIIIIIIIIIIVVVVVKDSIPTKHANQLIQFQPEENFPNRQSPSLSRHFFYAQHLTQGQPLNSQCKMIAASQDKMFKFSAGFHFSSSHNCPASMLLVFLLVFCYVI
jgi:hypothetical protein